MNDDASCVEMSDHDKMEAKVKFKASHCFSALCHGFNDLAPAKSQIP